MDVPVAVEPVVEIAGLADVEQRARLIEHPIHARSSGDATEERSSKPFRQRLWRRQQAQLLVYRVLGFPARCTRNEKPRPFSNGSTVATISSTG